jgi:hypothetical protein
VRRSSRGPILAFAWLAVAAGALGPTGAGAAPEGLEEAAAIAMTVTAELDEASDEVAVRIGIPVPAGHSGVIELIALPFDGVEIRDLFVGIGPGLGSATPAMGSRVAGPGQPTANTSPQRAVRWIVDEATAQAAAGGVLRLEYAVGRAVRLDGDRLEAVVPVVAPSDAALAPAFEARLAMPDGYVVFAAFPSELARRHPEGAPSAALPTPVSVLRVEARRGRAPAMTLARGLDVAALLVLGSLLGAGALRLRRELRGTLPAETARHR